MKLYFLSIILLFTIYIGNSQERKVFEFDYTLTSDAFGDDRKITVYLPPQYYEDDLAYLKRKLQQIKEMKSE